jgi:hypothetical protein
MSIKKPDEAARLLAATAKDVADREPPALLAWLFIEALRDVRDGRPPEESSEELGGDDRLRAH